VEYAKNGRPFLVAVTCKKKNFKKGDQRFALVLSII